MLPSVFVVVYTYRKDSTKGRLFSPRQKFQQPKLIATGMRDWLHHAGQTPWLLKIQTFCTRNKNLREHTKFTPDDALKYDAGILSEAGTE